MKIEVDDFTYDVIRTVKAEIDEMTNYQEDTSDDGVIQSALMAFLTMRYVNEGKGKFTYAHCMQRTIDNVLDMKKAIEIENRMKN